MRRVDDRRPRAQAAARVEQLDRPQPMLGEALLDLARLLVGMDVKRQLLLGGITADLLEPVSRTGADGMGGDADTDPVRPELLELAEVGRHRVLPESLEPAARIGNVEKDELDFRLGRGLSRDTRLLESEVVELADRRVPRCAELPVHVCIARPHLLGSLAAGELEHRLPPGPEVVSLRSPAQRPLERMAMRVDEPGDPRQLGHAEEHTSRTPVSFATWMPRLQQSRRRSHSSRTRSPSLGSR